MGGSRTAPLCQQTLRVQIDWSYDLLTETEQRVLRAVFRVRRGLDAGGPRSGNGRGIRV